MSDMTAADIDKLSARHASVLKSSRRAAWWPIGILAAALVYLTYAWFAFDIPSLIERARLDRGAIMATDSFAYKYHITWTARDREIVVDVEGGRGTEMDDPPAWVDRGDGEATVDLGEGYSVYFREGLVRYTEPDGETYRIDIGEEEVTVEGWRAVLDETEYVFIPPGESRLDAVDEETFRALGVIPEGASFATKKFEVRPTLFKRVQVTRTRIQVHRYFFGWEFFWFGPRSPLAGMGAGEVWSLINSDERIDPDMSNLSLVASEFWNNPDWQHGEVFIALVETVLMAVLGTFIAAFVGLPLAFLAAANFNPVFIGRFAIRRLFDFLRGIDQLIWSLIFIRAFGLGPLTGVMAIGFTDTGTLGKLFSEAIENIDNKQVEGVRATGASRIQRYRYGVIPQILPVFVSQTLYYLESNTRSATVIGALGAGGIGLKLVETLRTAQDWENTLYIILLTLAVVIAMDISSGWLRRKLIGEDARPG